VFAECTAAGVWRAHAMLKEPFEEGDAMVVVRSWLALKALMRAFALVVQQRKLTDFR